MAAQKVLSCPSGSRIPLGVAVVLALYQQFRVYRIHKDGENREELFQIVTENAADMIALVDMKGRRLYQQSRLQTSFGYSAARARRDIGV